MIGYIFSIIMVLGSSTFCIVGGIYWYPQDHQPHMLRKFYAIPHMAYVRIFFILSEECGWNQCLSSWAQMKSEVLECIAVLYLDAVVILVLAIYLNEILP